MIINLKDPRTRSLIASLTSRGLILVGSFVFSYYLFRSALTYLDPTNEDKKRQKQNAELLAKRLNLSNKFVQELNEYELYILTDLINPLDLHISWNDIGGLDEIINDLRQTVIYPLQHPELFQQSKLLTVAKGVLLYGPPGCGKTMIAKAIAKEAGANFINLQVTSLLDKWYGESQKRTAAIFTLAKKLQPVIIFIDEIDSFMRIRQEDDHESTRMVKFHRLYCFLFDLLLLLLLRLDQNTIYDSMGWLRNQCTRSYIESNYDHRCYESCARSRRGHTSSNANSISYSIAQ